MFLEKGSIDTTITTSDDEKEMEEGSWWTICAACAISN